MSNNKPRELKRILIACHTLPLYENFYLWMVVSPDIVKAWNQIMPKERNGEVDGRKDGVVVNGNDATFMFLKYEKGLSHNTIAHELTHVAQYYCRKMDIPVKPKNHEAYAYMIGHLTGAVYKKLKKWKLECR